ncbi:MAG: bifunctional nuclease family protein [Myxococcota bacterium]|jgi:hypothetical protein
MIELNVIGLMIDPSSNAPVVVLRESAGERVMPIWIGQMEALSIQSALENETPPRPMTHDLMTNMIRRLGATMTSVEISDLKDSTFFALLRLDRGGEQIAMDSRPSDAIALAVRFGARIYTYEEVLSQVKLPESAGGGDKDKWSEVLGSLGPESFGKYKM